MRDYTGRGFRIHYVQEGSGDPVVFAHGFVMDHTMFAPQFEDLPDRYRCVAWDMRGHGLSGHPDGPWTLDEIVNDLIAFIRAVEAAPCHLAGMSIGGMLALRVALREPALVRSLVLIDTSADREEEANVPQYRGFMDAIDREGLTDELAVGTLPLFYGEKYRTAEPDATAIHVARAIQMPRVALVEGIRSLVERDSVVDRLAEIRVPTIVVHGEQDAAIGMHQAERIASGIAGAELVRVPEAGHTTPLEASDLVNQTLARFLERVS